MNAIAEAMHLLDDELQDGYGFEARALDAPACEDLGEDDEPPPRAFDSERVLDWTVERICACSSQAESALHG